MNSKPKVELRTESMMQATKDRIEAGRDKEYFYEFDKSKICKFTKIRHIISDGTAVPLEQHWVEYVDLSQYNKIIKNFTENTKRCNKGIKQLKPVVEKLKKMLGTFDLAAYQQAKELITKFEELHKYQSQLETAELQKVDTAKWKELYMEAKEEFDQLNQTE